MEMIYEKKQETKWDPPFKLQTWEDQFANIRKNFPVSHIRMNMSEHHRILFYEEIIRRAINSEINISKKFLDQYNKLLEKMDVLEKEFDELEQQIKQEIKK